MKGSKTVAGEKHGKDAGCGKSEKMGTDTIFRGMGSGLDF